MSKLCKILSYAFNIRKIDGLTNGCVRESSRKEVRNAPNSNAVAVVRTGTRFLTSFGCVHPRVTFKSCSSIKSYIINHSH